MKTNDNMHIIFHGRFPSEKAASIFAAKSAESFSTLGKKVTLWVPRRRGRVRTDPFEYYGIKRNFEIKYVPVFDLFWLPMFKSVFFRLSFASFSVSVALYLLIKGSGRDLYYSNESLPLLLLSFIFSRTCYEMHDFPEKNMFFYKILFSRVQSILVHNNWKLQRLCEIMGGKIKKAFYEPNAVELRVFDIDISQEKAREMCAISLEKKIVVYTGHLYGWKGVDTLAISADYLPENIEIVFVGGTTADVTAFKGKYGNKKNVRIVGHKLHREIPIWQKAADIVALPNTAKENISSFYTSPMKLFEYMASRRPIIATDIPSIREILNKNNAFIVSPDNPEAMAKEIMCVLEDKDKAKSTAERAFLDVSRHTWEERAKRVLDFIKERTPRQTP